MARSTKPARPADPGDDRRRGALVAAGAWLATSRTTFILAAAVIVAVVGAVVVVLVLRATGHTGSSDHAAAPATAVVSAPAPAPADQGASGFGPPSADLWGRPIAHPNNPAGQALPQHPVDRPPYTAGDVLPSPEGMMWQQVGPWALPFSTSDGPTRIVGPLAEGFAHTPQGAALAVWQIAQRATVSHDSSLAVFTHQVVATGAQKAAIDANPGKFLGFSPDEAAAMSRSPRPSAFKVTGWTGDYAVIQYAFPDKDPGTYFTQQLEGIWQDGDWKWRMPDVAPPVGAAESLAGWTTW